MIETCAVCGFDGADWTDDSVVDALAELSVLWVAVLAGIDTELCNV